MKITMEGKYRTREGRAVKLLCIDAKRVFSVIGLITNRDEDKSELLFAWEPSGGAGEGSVGPDDLIPVTTKHEGWMIVNAWGQPIGSDIYNTEEFAKQDQYCGASGCYAVRVAWEAYA